MLLVSLSLFQFVNSSPRCCILIFDRSEVDRFEDKVDELEGINDDLELTVAAISDENLRTKGKFIDISQADDTFKPV